MRENSKISEEKLDKLRKLFNKSLEMCIQVFGKNVFIDTTKNKPKQSIVYYDLLMHGMANIPKSKIKGQEAKIRAAFVTLCEKSDFQRTLSGGIQNKSSILKRRQIWEKLIGPILG
jgi:hypothetical protein